MFSVEKLSGSVYSPRTCGLVSKDKCVLRLSDRTSALLISKKKTTKDRFSTLFSRAARSKTQWLKIECTNKMDWGDDDQKRKVKTIFMTYLQEDYVLRAQYIVRDLNELFPSEHPIEPPSASPDEGDAERLISDNTTKHSAIARTRTIIGSYFDQLSSDDVNVYYYPGMRREMANDKSEVADAARFIYFYYDVEMKPTYTEFLRYCRELSEPKRRSHDMKVRKKMRGILTLFRLERFLS